MGELQNEERVEGGENEGREGIERRREGKRKDGQVESGVDGWEEGRREGGRWVVLGFLGIQEWKMEDR